MPPARRGGRATEPSLRILPGQLTDNARSIAVCGRLGMTHLGRTGRYFGVTLELFRLRAGDLDHGGAG